MRKMTKKNSYEVCLSDGWGNSYLHFVKKTTNKKNKLVVCMYVWRLPIIVLSIYLIGRYE